MELCFILLLFTTVQYIGVSGRIEYNTVPLPPPSKVTKHVPEVIAKTCYLLPQHGPCRANIKMYYYDTEKKNCTSFTWGGCQGNGNRFDSRKECLSTCLSRPDMPATRPRFCQLTFDYGFCFGASKRWFYDKFWKVCKETIYSGCGGNQNNFYTMEKCDEVCRRKGYSKATTAESHEIKKSLVINPPEATAKRGLDQKTSKASKTTKKPSNNTTSCKNDSKRKDVKDTKSKKSEQSSSDSSSE